MHILYKTPFVFLLILLSCGAYLHADVKTLHGLPLAYEKLEPADSSSVFLTLFGKTKIVPNQRVDDVLVEEYFKRSDLFERFTIAQVESFISESLSSDNSHHADIAFTKLVEKLLGKERAIEELLVFLSAQQGSHELFKRFLVDQSTDPTLLQLLYDIEIAVGLQDPAWVRKTLSSLHYKDRELFTERLTKRFVKALTEENDVTARAVITLGRTLFGAKDPLIRKYFYILEQSRTIKEAAKKGESEKILPLLEASRSDPLLKEALRPFVLEQIHESARRSLDTGDPVRAIQTIIEIKDEAERTPRTYQIALEALSKLDADGKKILLDLEVAHYYVTLAGKDKGLKKHLLSTLERHALYLAKYGAYQTAEEFASRVKELRPDPHVKNDKIKFALALAAIGDDKILRAREYLKDMARGPSLSQKTSLLLAGYYVNLYALLLLILVPIGIFTLAVLKIRKIFREAEEDPVGWRREYDVNDEEQFLSQTQSILDSGHTLHPRKKEYHELLSFFGLPLDVEEKEIKAAYRSMIKKVHPDLHHETSSDSDDFIELTNAYERILELRKILQL